MSDYSKLMDYAADIGEQMINQVKEIRKDVEDLEKDRDYWKEECRKLSESVVELYKHADPPPLWSGPVMTSARLLKEMKDD